MRVLDRKLLRECRRSWGLLLTITLVVTVGVACYVSFGTTYRNLQQAKQRFYTQCRMADFWVDVKKAPLAELDRAVRLPGVAATRSRMSEYVTIGLPKVQRPLNGLVLSLPDRREEVVNDIVLKKGGYFSPQRQNEVIVSDEFAEAYRLAPGDTIEVVLNDRHEELILVGTAISSEFVYMLAPGAMVPDAKRFGVLYLKKSFAEEAFDFQGAANQLVGRLSFDQKEPVKKILDRIETFLEPYGVITTTPLADQASNKYLSQEIEGLRAFAIFMPIVFLAVAALILNVLMTRTAQQQRTVIGTLKALGYSNATVFVHFLKFGLAIGLVGGLLGSVLGHLFSQGLTAEYRKIFIFPELMNEFSLSHHALGMAVSLLCALTGSLYGAYQVLRLQPAEAMRPRPPRKGHAVLLERFSLFWNRLGTTMRMSLRNVFRNRMRTVTGVMAACLGAGLLLDGFMMVAGTYYLMDFQFKWTRQADMELTFRHPVSFEALDEASRLPGVDRAEPVLTTACHFIAGPYRRKLAVMGLAKEARLTVPRDTEGHPIAIPDEGLLMSAKLARLMHVTVGDRIVVRPVEGLREAHEVEVKRLVDGYLGTAVYANLDWWSRTLGEEPILNGVQLALDGNLASEKRLYRELKEIPTLQATASRHDMIRTMEETFMAVLNVFIGIFVLFTAVVFFGSILNASLVSLAERQTETATLRVLGYGPWQVGRVFLYESVLVNAVGILLGLPVGYLMTLGVAMVYDTELFRFPVVCPLWCVVATVLFGAAFTISAHLLVQRQIHRQDWRDALLTKNE